MADTAKTLEWKYVQLGLSDLYRTPILLAGADEMMLIDGGFTLSSGHRLVDEIKSAGRTLSTIFITCDDSDYYFGLGPVVAAFPHAKLLATPGTAARIRDTASHKIDVWKPKLGDECPQGVGDVAFPAPCTDSRLTIDGVVIEVEAAVQPNRYHLWIDSLRAILGGVQIVGGIHVWMADTPTVEQRGSWIKSLEDMVARRPREAQPGHMFPGSAPGLRAIQFTRQYIEAFDRELSKADDAQQLIRAMKEIYPNLAMDFVLELSARVCKGEALWP